MTREELLALADELEGMDCRTCPADGTKDCRDLPCEEAVARAASRRIREVVEHDACEDATVSAYDLLPEEDRKALAWVREHGGLGAVEKRLMPEGMEWPKVDGKPVDFKTVYVPSLGVLEAVSIYNTGACQVMSHDGIIKSAKDIHIEKPEALDADGVPCRDGDEVWEVRSHRRREIVGTNYRDHRTGEPLILCDGDDAIPIPATWVTHTKPEPFDSWERIEEDAEKTVCEYFGANYDCANCPLEPDRCDEEAKKDIIRRAKKLAERGA